MLPDTANKRLKALPEISRKGGRINGLFRLLENPDLWKQAYANTYSNKGAMTPGVGPTTMDGFSMERVANLIELLKAGRYQPNPVRRSYVPKPNGKRRPLGVPSGDDKLVQEVVRIVLEQIYEPIFSNRSHGFRPSRSCHTALKEVERWDGTKWLVEVDIKGFFDNIDHSLMIRMLEKKIDDKRFIALLRTFLKAGYMEDWRFHPTYSGTPQGGIISPILANIYLHELDRFMEERIAEFNRGKVRTPNWKYRTIGARIRRRREKIRRLQDEGGNNAPEIRQLRQEILEADTLRKRMPSGQPSDPAFRRLFYSRYADDSLIGVIGSIHDAKHVMSQVREFIQNDLKLEVAEEKSTITQAKKGTVFLGYEVITRSTMRVRRQKRGGVYTRCRTVSEQMTLRIPEDKLLKFCHHRGYGNYTTLKTVHRPYMRERSDAEIILAYNAELRGLVNYYALAYNAKRRLSKLYYLWKGGLFKTLAAKHKATVTKVVAKLRQGDRFVYQYEVKGKKISLPLFSLKHWKLTGSADRSVDIVPYIYAYTAARTELIKRLSAESCEYCGKTQGYFEVHHVRQMSDIADGKQLWQKLMMAMRRKTLVLCIECHDLLHSGKLPDWRHRSG